MTDAESPDRPNESHEDWIASAKAEFEDAARKSAFTSSSTAASPMGRPRVEWKPASFPGYEIRNEIHRGGQGVVYRSMQQATRREVAIKVLREGPFAGVSDKARFEREVQILGQLKHPNIVTIHDSGSSAGGFYFVMDYIPGNKLDDYVTEQSLSVRRVLELFVKICDAVNVAHLRGIIHRDLKPSNIRVDPSGEPHILDFGLAKVTEFDVMADPRSEVRTTTGQFIGSLPWASPEQVDTVQDVVDIRTDVYALGVILYELLTARFPYEVTGTVREVLNNICNAEPQKPSSIRKGIDDDVDTIVLKCLDKDRDQRYQSSGNLAREVRRYLAGEPIEAKRDSFTYILRKLFRKHKIKFAVVGGFVAIITAALVTSVVFWRDAVTARDQATDEASKAKAINDFLQDMLHAADPAYPGHKLTLEDVLRSAAIRIEEGRFEGRPEAEAAIRRTIGSTYTSLGLFEHAEQNLETALQLTGRRRGSEDLALDTMTQIGRLYREQGRAREAQAVYAKALAGLREKRGPEDAVTLETELRLIATIHDLGKLKEAEEKYNNIIQRAEAALGKEHRVTLLCIHELGSLLRQQMRLTEASKIFRDLLSTYRTQRGENHPDTLTAMNNLANTLSQMQELDEAEPLSRQVLNGVKEVWGPRHPHALIAMGNLATLLSNRGEFDEPRELMTEAHAIAREELGEAHPTALKFLNNLAFMFVSREMWKEAEPLCRELLNLLRRGAGDLHPHTFVAVNQLATICMATNRFDEAEALYNQILDAREKALGAKHMSTILVQFHIALLKDEAGETEKANQIYRHCAEFAAEIAEPGQLEPWAMRSSWAACQTRLKQYAEAEANLLSSHDKIRAIVGDRHPITLVTAERLVELYSFWEKPEKAAEWKAKMSPQPGG